MAQAKPKPEKPVDPFEGYIGQQSLVETVRSYLYLEVLPNMFFVAMKGSGKTDLARRIAQASGKPFHEFGCRQGMKLDAFLNRIGVTWNGGVIFFDELPLMPKATQGSLRTLAEEGIFFDKEGDECEFPGLTILAAGTDITKVDDDLLSRFDIMEFAPYSIDDLTLIGQGFDMRYETNLELTTIQSLAVACNQSPRKLRHLFQYNAKAVSLSGDKTSTDTILSNARLDVDGLSILEITVLRRMARFIADGVNPTLSRLATALQMRERALIPSIENLQAFGFVNVSMGPGGTKLTKLGRDKIREIGLEPNLTN